MDYEELGRSVGALIKSKNAAYGDSFHRSGDIMKILFPNGIQPSSYTDVLAIVRIIDKLFRLATDPNYGGESPWKDIAGYSLLRLADKEENSLLNLPKREHKFKFDIPVSPNDLPEDAVIDRMTLEAIDKMTKCGYKE